MPTIGYLLLPRPELEGIIHLVKNFNKPAFIWLKTQTNPILIYYHYQQVWQIAKQQQAASKNQN